MTTSEKKLGPDLSNTNYRLVSNLKFISKLVEKYVLMQLEDHLTLNGLYADHQSAYEKGHSCETLLPKVVNDILWALEHQELNAMLMLHLSAAFPMVDHQLLILLLDTRYEIHDTALLWYQNYLKEHQFKVTIDGSILSEKIMNFSVPQGSPLGPILLNCYCSTLWDIIPTNIDLNGYADDHALPKNFKANTEQEKIMMQTFEKCMFDVESWMNGNRLKLNPNKTEFIIFGSSIQLVKCTTEQINICVTEVKKCKLLFYLGAWLDATLNFKHHTNMKCCTALVNLKKIQLIRNLLDRESCAIWHCHISTIVMES